MPPAWAYQVKNFDPSPDEELVCSICQAVFCDPVQSPCNHVFCRNCITKWLENSRSCPICRRSMPRYAVERVVPLIKNIIMKLTLRCHNQECEEKFTLENCEAHIKKCIFEVIRCKNKPCQQMVQRWDVQNHETNDCAHRYVRCEKCCLKFSTNIPQTHDCVKALKQKLIRKQFVLKKANKKIKELQATIKNQKAVGPDSSDMSSHNMSSHNSSSDVDIMIDLGDIPGASSSLSMNSNSNSDHFDSDTDDESFLRLFTFDVLDRLEMSQRLNNSMEATYLESSVGSPLASTPGVLENENLNNTESTLEEPQMRRPAKRRLPAYHVDSSDEDDLERPSQSPSKRNCQVFEDGGETSSRIIPDHGQESNSSSSHDIQSGGDTVGIPSHDESFSQFAANPLRHRMDSMIGSSSTMQSKFSPFQRTIDLLEQYNSESDTEWLPPENSGNATDLDSPVSLLSSGSETDTDVENPNLTTYILSNFSSDSTSDPDWEPPI